MSEYRVSDDDVQRGVSLADYEEVLQQIVPNARLTKAKFGLSAQWYVQVSLPYDRAVSPEHATEMMRSFGEYIRARAIRELGVQPILDGYRREAEEAARENRSLKERLATARERIAALEEMIADE
jgi:hypothetical protein